ncbi:uncharacterized protein Dwil_GK27461 [Drosophila willistoni]|uniref:Uncharacterized protein n=1 Tax=Drosophila willistoni TaxID=7260 RepID=A0A0Q9WU69_DROWI|nr:uncharacterized protein Dwil_GK27461 [Drosophila willistoni]
MDIIFASIGVFWIIKDDFPPFVHVFFAEMDTRTCVTCFSVCFYLMSSNDAMLIYGAIARKRWYMGPWLLVNFCVLICTLVTALLSALAIIRLIILCYSMLVVSSFYDELTEMLQEDKD